MNVFVPSRPRLPSLRAQSVAVVHAAHALARQGFVVRVPYEPADGDPLRAYGLGPTPGLVLVPLPSGGTAASLAFRAHVLAAAARGDTLLARDLRYAAGIARLPGARLVFEAHGVDSLQDAEAGRDPWPAHRQEARVLAASRALICNCAGVLEGLGRLHRLPGITRVVRNASPPARQPGRDGVGVAVAGSLIPGKDLPTVARAARAIGGVTLLGAHPDGRFRALQALAGGALIPGGSVPPAELPDRLGDFRTLILPLGRGWFGEQLTDPLKGWAYQAARVPFVGADTPALHRSAPGAFLPYRPGDPDDLAAAVARVQTDEGLRSRLRAAMVDRTWEDRAAEIAEVLRDL